MLRLKFGLQLPEVLQLFLLPNHHLALLSRQLLLQLLQCNNVECPDRAYELKCKSRNITNATDLL